MIEIELNSKNAQSSHFWMLDEKRNTSESGFSEKVNMQTKNGKKSVFDVTGIDNNDSIVDANSTVYSQNPLELKPRTRKFKASSKKNPTVNFQQTKVNPSYDSEL